MTQQETKKNNYTEKIINFIKNELLKGDFKDEIIRPILYQLLYIVIPIVLIIILFNFITTILAIIIVSYFTNRT